MDMLEDKNINISVSINVNGNSSPVNTQQTYINGENASLIDSKQFQYVNVGYEDAKASYFGYNLGGESGSLKSTSPSEEITRKSPKFEVTLNTLQQEQNNLIEQRIQDRVHTLRAMNVNSPTATPLWTNHNNYTNRMFSNVEINGVSPSSESCLFPSQISSCMFGANRNMESWFKETNFTSDSWPADYSEDPTMRSRPCFSSHQTRELEQEFTICQYVTRRRRIELAYSLSLTEKQIKTWFQNRRVKERKQKKLSANVTKFENST